MRRAAIVLSSGASNEPHHFDSAESAVLVATGQSNVHIYSQTYMPRYTHISSMIAKAHAPSTAGLKARRAARPILPPVSRQSFIVIVCFKSDCRVQATNCQNPEIRSSGAISIHATLKGQAKSLIVLIGVITKSSSRQNQSPSSPKRHL